MYKTALDAHLSTQQRKAASLVPWGRLLLEIINMQLPNEAVPENEEERETSERLKAKKVGVWIVWSSIPTVRTYPIIREHP